MTTTKSSIVGAHYDSRTIRRLSAVLAGLWRLVQREAHRDDRDARIRAVFGQIAESPLFVLCRALRDERKEPLSRSRETIDAVETFLRRRENLSVLPHAFCATVTVWIREMQKLRAEAKLERSSGAKAQLDAAVICLKAELWPLTTCGLLAELPSAPRHFSANDEELQIVAGVLLNRYQVIGNAASSSSFEPGVRLDLAEIRGFTLFQGVRAQNHRQAESGVRGISSWLAGAQSGRRRRLYCNIAQGLHDLACKGVKLRRAMLAAPENSPRRNSRMRALLVAEITQYDVWMTGLMEGVGAC